MSNSVSNELTAVKNLVNKGKFEEVLQLTKDIEQKQNLTHEELLGSMVYRGFSHFYLG